MEKLGKYVILGELGRGAGGIVYRARDPIINRLVALKTITTGLAEFPDLLQRFYQEAQSAGGLQHPNIVTIFDMGDENGIPYIAMELVDGESLDQLIARRTSIAIPVKLMYAYQACKAFDYAHKRGIVHRDIKPDNVMLTKDGTVKVVDFGIARVLETSRTQTGMLLGTFAYMSPEQYHGEHADARSDIWSFGVLLYELLAYERPFKGQTPASLMHSICAVEPAPLSQALPGCPPILDKILQQTLRKSPADRYQSMEDLLLDLDPLCKSLQSESMASLMDQSRQCAEQGDFSQARDLLRQVLQIDSTHGAARTYLDKMNVELRRIQVRPRVQHHVESGLALLAQGKTQEARVEAEMALQLDTNYEAALDLRKRVQEEVKRAQQVAEWVEAAQRRLAEGNPEEAEELVGKVLELEPTSEQAKALRQQVSEAKAEQQRRIQFAEKMKAARKLWTQQSYEECIQLLSELQKQYPGEDEIPALIETAREDQANQRRLQSLAQARGLLANERYDECIGLLKELSRQFPNDEETPRLLKKVLEEQAQRRRSLALAEARALLSGRKFKEGIALLDSLQKEFPEDGEIQKLRKKGEEEQRKLRLLQALEDARALLTARRYEDCVAFLGLLAKEFPDEAEIRKLRSQAEEDQKRQRRFQGLEEARALFTAKRYEDCLAFLKPLQKEFPDDAEIESIPERIEEELRKQRLLEALEEGRALLKAERFDECVAFVKSLPGELQKEEEIARLAERAKAEKSERERRQGIANAKKLLGAKRYQECNAALSDLLKRFPKDPEIQALLDSSRNEENEERRLKGLTEARSLLASHKHEACIALLTQLQQTYPGDKEVLKLLENVREDQAEQRRLQSLTEARNLIAARRYDDSISALNDLQKKFPADEQTTKLLEIAREERTEQQKQQMLGEARTHFAARRFTEARALVEKLSKAHPRDSAIQKLQGLIQQEEEKQASLERLQRELTALKSLVNEKKYPEVLSRSDRILKEFPGNADLSRLVEFSRTQQAQIEKENRQRKLLQEARELIQAKRFEDAYRAALAGLKEFPEFSELQRLRDQADTEQRKLETRQHIEQRVREIKFKINRGKISEAIDLANDTLVTLGPDTDVTQLLNSARIEYLAREKKREEEEKLQTIRVLIDSGDFEAAARTLNEAVSTKALEAFDPRIQRVADEIEAAKAAAAAATEAKTLPPAPTLSKEYAWLQAPPVPEGPDVDEAQPTGEVTQESHATQAPIPSKPAPVPAFRQAPEPAKTELAPTSQEAAWATPPPQAAQVARALEPSSSPRVGPGFAWRRPAAFAAVALTAITLVWGTVRFVVYLGHRAASNTSRTTPAASTAAKPSLETQQRDALKATDKLVAANDLDGALRVLADAAALNGPLAAEIDKKRAAIEESMKDQNLRELRHQEEQLWQQAQDDVAKGRFTQAQNALHQILKLGDGGIRKADAQQYLTRTIPDRQREENLFSRAQQAMSKGDLNSLQSADNLLAQVVSLKGQRQSEAEQLQKDTRGKIAGMYVTAAQQDLQRGDFHASRLKANAVQQTGADAAPLLAEIDKAEQNRLSQLESQFNQLRQSDDEAAVQQLSGLQKGFQPLADSGGPRADEAKTYISNVPAAIRDVQTRAAAKRAEAGYQQLIQRSQQALNGNDKTVLESFRSALQGIAVAGGPHAAEAQRYADQISAKLTAMQPPPPPVKPETPSGPSDNDAVMALIKRYSQAFDQRSADALQQIWPNMGKRYAGYKNAFEGASAIRMEVRTESVSFSSSGDVCTVAAQFTEEYTPQGQKPRSVKGRTIFQFAKVNGSWIITDVQ